MGLCSCLLPYKMVKFLGTIKSSPANIYKIQHSREIWSSDVKLFKFRWWFHIFFIFSPIPGEIIQSDEHIFQMGWFNHHFCIDATLGRQVKMTPEKLACAVFIPCIYRWNMMKPQFWLNKHRGTHIHIRIYICYIYSYHIFICTYIYTYLVFHCLFDIDYLHFYTWLLHLWWFFLNLQRLKNVRKICGGYRCQPLEEWLHPYPNNGGTTALMDQKSGKLTSWGWLVVENPHYLQGFEKKTSLVVVCLRFLPSTSYFGAFHLLEMFPLIVSAFHGSVGLKCIQLVAEENEVTYVTTSISPSKPSRN